MRARHAAALAVMPSPAQRRVGLDREQHVGGLGLAVGRPRVVRAALRSGCRRTRPASAGAPPSSPRRSARRRPRRSASCRPSGEREVARGGWWRTAAPSPRACAARGVAITPALLTSTCSGPLPAARRTRRPKRWSARSSRRDAHGRAPVVAAMSSAVRSPASVSRTASVTSAPAPASARAVSTPMPDARAGDDRRAARSGRCRGRPPRPWSCAEPRRRCVPSSVLPCAILRCGGSLRFRTRSGGSLRFARRRAAMPEETRLRPDAKRNREKLIAAADGGVRHGRRRTPA